MWLMWSFHVAAPQELAGTALPPLIDRFGLWMPSSRDLPIVRLMNSAARRMTAAEPEMSAAMPKLWLDGCPDLVVLCRSVDVTARPEKRFRMIPTALAMAP